MTKRKNKKSSQIESFFPDWLDPKWLNLMVFLSVFILYGNTLGHDYTQDDAIVIYDNMYTTEGISGIPGLWNKDTFHGFFKVEGKDKLVSGGRYRPLTPIMFAMEYELFGNKPFFGHLINILFYGLLGLIVFWSLKLLLARYLDQNLVLPVAFVTAMLFLAHPIHTEVVANIKGRDEIISLLCSMSSIWLILKSRFNPTNKILALSGVLFLLGFFSKENTVCFLGVIPLIYLLFYRREKIGGFIKYYAVCLLGFFLFMLKRTQVLGLDFGGNPPAELMNNPFIKIVGSQYVSFDWSEKMATIIYTLGKYLQLMVFPHPLTHDYYPRQVGVMNFGDYEVWLSLMAILSLIVLSIRMLKKNKLISFGILYFFMCISIVSNILFPVGTNMSERFLFMPSLGLVLIMSWFIGKHIKKPRWSFIFFAILLLLYTGKTIDRNMVWKDDFTLFTTDVKTSTKSAKVLNAAGGALTTKAAEISDEAKKREMLNQAIEYLTEAIRIHPNYKNAHLIKGNAYFYLNQYEQAINSYSNALKISPGYEEASLNIGIAYRDAGRYFGEKEGDLNKSINYLRRAYEFRPNEYETVRLLATALGIANMHQEAVNYFEIASKLNPNEPQAFVNLGNAYFNLGMQEKGNFNYSKALELDPKALDKYRK